MYILLSMISTRWKCAVQFYSGRSTSTSLIEFTSFYLRNMDRGHQVDAIYMDLKAGFDRVDWRLLLEEIWCMGAVNSCVLWLESYLTDRRLSVKLGDTEIVQVLQPIWSSSRKQYRAPLFFAVLMMYASCCLQVAGFSTQNSRRLSRTPENVRYVCKLMQ